MNNISTAEEFIKRYNSHEHAKSEGCGCGWRDLVAMREFAKFHVEAALKAVSNHESIQYDVSSLNAYPLTNIK